MSFTMTVTADVSASATHPPGTVLDEHGDPVIVQAEEAIA